MILPGGRQIKEEDGPSGLYIGVGKNYAPDSFFLVDSLALFKLNFAFCNAL